MKNLVSCHAVADWFLLSQDVHAGDAITNLKMQKLCYYAQAWHLTLHNTPLFSEEIQAWRHGPVVPELYERFKEFGWQSIDVTSLKTDPFDALHRRHRDYLDIILFRYGSFSGKQLENLTHSEKPWKKYYKAKTPHGHCDCVIPHSAMQDFYQKQL